MIALDAVAMVEALVGAKPPAELLEALEGDIHAPHLLDLEVIFVLRVLELGRVVGPRRAEEALDDYWGLSIERHDLEPVRQRVWELRHQFTSYDASYVALAEALAVPLVTCDKKLATSDHWAKVILIAGAS